ncbi:MAG TPA: YciI family protein [Actinocrinis sp.]|jgi:hypothetical protein
MLLVYGADPEAETDGSAPPPAGTGLGRIPWVDQLVGLGVELHDGAMLRDAAVATTVRAGGGDVLLSDGPFAEAREQIVGYQVIECADLDAALEAAARHPALGGGCAVEIRPIAQQRGDGGPSSRHGDW